MSDCFVLYLLLTCMKKKTSGADKFTNNSRELDGNIRYRIRMCIWKHWKTPQNKEKNLVKLGVPRWAAHKVANTGNRYAHMCHNGWIQKAISIKRLTSFGLVSMLDYYTERCTTC